jgi:hypothetical protein
MAHKANPVNLKTRESNSFNQLETRKIFKTDSDWSDSEDKLLESRKWKQERAIACYTVHLSKEKRFSKHIA